MAVAAAAPQYAGYTPGYTPGYSPTPAPYISKEGAAQIVKQVSDQKEDGSFSWQYETQNGIAAAETNLPKAGPNGEIVNNVEGGYQYTAPDGTPIAIRYRANEDGFVAEGPSIPVAPPIPEEILRALAWNAAHPEEEAQWDPAYNRPVQPAYQG